VLHTNYIVVISARVAQQLYCSAFCTCGTEILSYCLLYVWRGNYILVSSICVAQQLYCSFFYTCSTPTVF